VNKSVHVHGASAQAGAIQGEKNNAGTCKASAHQ
jgi:hypothetical protein